MGGVRLKRVGSEMCDRLDAGYYGVHGWLLVIRGFTEWFVGVVRVLRCEVGRGGLKMFASSNPTVIVSNC